MSVRRADHVSRIAQHTAHSSANMNCMTRILEFKYDFVRLNPKYVSNKLRTHKERSTACQVKPVSRPITISLRKSIFLGKFVYEILYLHHAASWQQHQVSSSDFGSNRTVVHAFSYILNLICGN